MDAIGKNDVYAAAHVGDEAKQTGIKPSAGHECDWSEADERDLVFDVSEMPSAIELRCVVGHLPPHTPPPHTHTTLQLARTL